MGCTSVRALEATLSLEEEALQEYEDSFGLSNINSNALYSNIRTHSVEEVHIKDIEDVLTSLGWAPRPFEESSLLMKFLLQYCKASDELINSKKLIMLGILLGCGSLESKALILFEVCDIDVSGKVSKSEMIDSFRNLIKIALNEIPSFAEQNIDPKMRRQIANFRSMISSMEATIVQHMLENFFSEEDEEIDSSDFIVVLQQTKAKYLTSSVGLRNFTFKAWEQVKKFDRILINLKVNKNLKDLNLRQMVEVLNDIDRETQPTKD